MVLCRRPRLFSRLSAALEYLWEVSEALDRGRKASWARSCYKSRKYACFASHSGEFCGSA